MSARAGRLLAGLEGGLNKIMTIWLLLAMSACSMRVGLATMGAGETGVGTAFPENVALVRWQPGTRFHRHSHPGGEEILVLDGELRDEHGVYPQGTWLRNPHMSVHTPYSETGCLIYVRVGGLLPRGEAG